MTKCDFCHAELETGSQPCCVAACPTRALSFGDYDALLELHNEADCNKTGPIAPLPEPEMTSPNLVIIPPKQAKSLNHTSGLIQNPEEVKDA